jgi:hypothetical protein
LACCITAALECALDELAFGATQVIPKKRLKAAMLMATFFILHLEE